MFVSRPVLFAVSCCYLFNASTVHAQLNLSNIIGEKTKNLTQQAPAKAVPSAPAAPKSTTNAVNALTNTSNTSANASVVQKVTGTTVLTKLYEERRHTAVDTDLDLLWQQLGVIKSGRSVRFDDNASEAYLRRAISTRAQLTMLARSSGIAATVCGVVLATSRNSSG